MSAHASASLIDPRFDPSDVRQSWMVHAPEPVAEENFQFVSAQLDIMPQEELLDGLLRRCHGCEPIALPLRPNSTDLEALISDHPVYGIGMCISVVPPAEIQQCTELSAFWERGFSNRISHKKQMHNRIVFAPNAVLVDHLLMDGGRLDA